MGQLRIMVAVSLVSGFMAACGVESEAPGEEDERDVQGEPIFRSDLYLRASIECAQYQRHLPKAFRSHWSSLNECAREKRTRWLTVAKLPGISLPNQTKCALELLQLSREAFRSVVLNLMDVWGLAGCGYAPHGALAGGELCGRDEQCRSGRCPRAFDPAGNGYVPCGRCAEQAPAKNQACATQGSETCAPGLYCDSGTCQAVPLVAGPFMDVPAMPLFDEGDACNYLNGLCKDHLVCRDRKCVSIQQACPAAGS